MTRKTQRYSKEFRAEAIKTVLERGLSISEGASLLSIPAGTLGQWVTAARKDLVTMQGTCSVAELDLMFSSCRMLYMKFSLNEMCLKKRILPGSR